MKEIVLSVRNVSKKFCRSLKKSLLYAAQDIGRELLRIDRRSSQLRSGEFWALKNVSFDLKNGESIGLIGRNGAGKTTLLRMISGLIKPDTGFLKIRGRVAPLIALGAGFHSMLSGRENIYANMSILGLSNKEINSKFDEIVDFAEIGDAIDAPLQTYSSGMIARLGFACAVHANADILLIDEVLAVGDIRFRAKCYRKLAQLRNQGLAFILVSHSPQSILSFCDSSIYLENGEVKAKGATSDVLTQYENDLQIRTDESQVVQPFLSSAIHCVPGLSIVDIILKDKNGNRAKFLSTAEKAVISIVCKAERDIKNIGVIAAFSSEDLENERVLYISTQNERVSLEVSKGINEICLVFPYCGLRLGVYSLKIVIFEGDDSTAMLCVLESYRFIVKSVHPMDQCAFYQPHQWKVEKKEKESLTNA